MTYLLSLLYPDIDKVVATEFDKAIIMIGTIVAIVCILMALSYILKWIIFRIYIRSSNETVQEAVTDIIYKLDELADEMSNKEKRKEAIAAVRDLFIWRSIPIPACIIGIIIDLEVASIRKMQAKVSTEKDPYLHYTEEELKAIEESNQDGTGDEDGEPSESQGEK